MSGLRVDVGAALLHVREAQQALCQANLSLHRASRLELRQWLINAQRSATFAEISLAEEQLRQSRQKEVV